MKIRDFFINFHNQCAIYTCICADLYTIQELHLQITSPEKCDAENEIAQVPRSFLDIDGKIEGKYFKWKILLCHHFLNLHNYVTLQSILEIGVARHFVKSFVLNRKVIKISFKEFKSVLSSISVYDFFFII